MTDLHEEFVLAGGTEGLRREAPWPNPSAPPIHPSARIHPTAVLWHFVVVLADAVIGHNVSIGSFSEIGRGVTIGNYSRIGSRVFLPPHTQIGHSVFIGPSVTLCDDKHPFVRQAEDGPYTAEPPVVEDYAAIGAGVVVLPGVRIGHHARVAAGAIVTKDVPPHGLVRGEPSRLREPVTQSTVQWVAHA